VRKLLAMTLLISAAAAFGQTPMPVQTIPIQAARQAFEKVPAADRGLACDDPARASRTELDTYCSLLANLLDPKSATVYFALYATQDESLLSSFLSSLADSNLGTHLGSIVSSPGTTNVAERSGYSSVLGLALESGAVTQSSSGNTLTLQANALSIYRLLDNQYVFQYCPGGGMDCQGGAWASFLNRVSGSAALTLSSASTQSVTGSASGGSGSGSAAGSQAPPSATALIQNSASQLTGFTVHFQIWNKLDLRSKEYIAAWKKAIGGKAVTTAAAAAVAKTNAFSWFNLQPKPPATTTADLDWLLRSTVSVRQAIQLGSDDSVVSNTIAQQWIVLIAAHKDDPNFSLSSIQQFLQTANLYLAARDAAVAEARQQSGSGLSFEYDYSRPLNQPRTSVLRLAYTLHPSVIASDTAGTGKLPDGTGAEHGSQQKGPRPSVNDTAITFNAAAEFYDSPPEGTSAFRDLQGAVQLDHHFGSTIGTLAGYYQYQKTPAAIVIGQSNLAPDTNITLPGAAATLLVPKGNIVVAQAKLTFSLKNGATVPVAFTWANRTELIKASEVRGHVGIDFDWSSLFASKSK
jgi:hypothetical protein